MPDLIANEGIQEGKRGKLEKYRDSDLTTTEFETIPSEQTLNSKKLRDFSNSRPDLRTNFSLDDAVNLTNDEISKSGIEINKKLRAAKGIADSRGISDKLNERDKDVFESSISKLIDERKISHGEAGVLRDAYSMMEEMKRVMVNMQEVKEDFSIQRRETLGDDIEGFMNGIVQNAKNSWNGWSSNQKLLFSGIAVLGGVMLFKADENSAAGKVRETLWSALKIGGAAYGGNMLVELLTGKSALTRISEWSRGTVGSEKYWEREFGGGEKSELVKKSLAYLGEKNFEDLAQKYAAAKSSGKRSIEGVVTENEMTGEEVFIALDAFFSNPKRRVNDMLNKYRNVSPKPSWRDVATTEIAEDAGSSAEPGLLTSAYEKGPRNWFLKSFNYISSIGPVNWTFKKGKEFSDWVSRKWSGEKNAEEKVKEFFKKFDHVVENDKDLKKYVSEKVVVKESEKKMFSELLDREAVNGLKYEKSGEFLYLICDTLVNEESANNETLAEAIANSNEKIANLLVASYGYESKGKALKTLDYSSGVYSQKNKKLHFFVKVPV